MKRPVKSKTTRSAKRDLFAELSEGMAALKARQGKRNLRAQAVEFKPSLRAKGAKCESLGHRPRSRRIEDPQR